MLELPPSDHQYEGGLATGLDSSFRPISGRAHPFSRPQSDLTPSSTPTRRCPPTPFHRLRVAQLSLPSALV